jgi:streptogramin lyase
MVFVALCIAISGCSSVNSPVSTNLFEIQSLHISPTNPVLPMLSEIQFYAIGVYKDGTACRLDATWECYYSTMASIDATGRLRSKTVSGYNFIRARYGTFEAMTGMTITAGTLENYSISPEAVTLAVGDSYIFSLVAKDSYGNNIDLSPSWNVEGEIGEVSSEYYYPYSIEGEKKGAKGIKYMSSSYSASAHFTAKAAGTGALIAKLGSFEARATIQVVSFTPYSFVTSWNTKVDSVNMSPRGIGVDNAGNIWATMYSSDFSGYETNYTGYVNKYDSSGKFILSLGTAPTDEGVLKMPIDIAFDSAGNIYVSDQYDSKIKKYDNSGNFITAWGGTGFTDGKFRSLGPLAIDKDNYIYVTDPDNHRVQKFYSSGSFIKSWGGYGSDAGEFFCPSGIAVDGSGNVYVADKYNHRIQKFDSLGTYLARWGKYGTALGDFYSLKGLTVDKDGKLFVLDDERDCVMKYEDGGLLLTRWGEYGSTSGKFNSPTDISVDGLGNVYVADHDNARIQKFEP